VVVKWVFIIVGSLIALVILANIAIIVLTALGEEVDEPEAISLQAPNSGLAIQQRAGFSAKQEKWW
jgi:hypothetical protein